MDVPRLSYYQEYGQMFLGLIEAERQRPSVARETSLYDYQMDAVIATWDHYSAVDERRPFLIVAPTGSGKSGIISMLPFVLESHKALVLTPSLDITRQLCKTFNGERPEPRFYAKVGLKINEQNGRAVTFDTLQGLLALPELLITNAHKLTGRSFASLIQADETRATEIRNALEPYSTLIVDEAHHFPAPTWRIIIEEFYGKQIIFLTATPYWYNPRRKKILLKDKFNTGQFQIPRDAVDGVTIRNSQFFEIELNVQNILSILREHDQLEPRKIHKAMVYVVSKKNMAKETERLSNLWNDIGGAGPITTYFNSEKRTKDNLPNFENDAKNIRILFVCGKLLEGYDNSQVSVCVIHSKIGSEIRFNQFVGRCLRKSYSDDGVIVAKVVSDVKFEQRPMWESYKDDGLGLMDEEENILV